MNKGPQKSTTEKYLSYIVDLITTHNLSRYDHVNLRDNELLNKYFPKTVNSAYSYMLKQLISMGIIENVTDTWVPKKQCKLYAINLNILKETMATFPKWINFDFTQFFPDYNPKTDLVTVFDENGNYTNYSSHLYNPTPLILTTYPYHYNNTKVEDLESIVWKLDPMDMNRVKFKTKNYSADDVENIKILMREYILSNNNIYNKCVELCNEINQKMDNNSKAKISLNITSSVSQTYTTIKLSCRQYNSLCGMDNKKYHNRDTILSTIGFDREFDLHSAIFAITRLLNTGEFDVDWDIKRTIFEWSEFSEDEKAEIKTMLNRCFFNASAGQAWSQYHYINHYHCQEDKFSKEMFEQFYNLVQSEIGGSYPYMNNIFLYESLFELLVIKELQDMDIDVRNVYDCFYYKSSQTDEQTIKQVISKVANYFNEYIATIS